MTTETVVDLREVTKLFGQTAAVRNTSLELRRGEILSLLGPSGCGKTTTLRLLAGFENPDGGEIWIDGRRVAGGGSTPVAAEHRRVGMVFQDYALFPHLTVEKNLAYGLAKGKKRASRIQEVLNLTRLDGLGDRMPHELSGGQQQRVALARALAPEPALVLLDEPFSNLDAALRAQVRAEVREILTDAGATAIFVTHDQEEALSIADEVAVMLKGDLIQKAPPEELYHHPATREVAEFVGEANFFPGVAEGGRVRTALGDLEYLGEGRGEVEAMLRPEFLALCKPREEHAGCEGTVVGRNFYGHDQLVKVRLDSGVEVSARLGSGPGFRPGSRVEVQAAGTAVAYPGTS